MKPLLDMPIIESLSGTIMTYAVIGAGSIIFAVTGEHAAVEHGFGDAQNLILICLSGGIAGGLLAVLLFPLTNPKQTAFKWLGSSVAAAAFGPAICQYYEINKDAVYCIAVSAMIGLLAWGLLLAAVPMMTTIARWVIRSRAPGAFKEDNK